MKIKNIFILAKEVEASAEWSKPSVYNLANINEGTHETSMAVPIVVRNNAELTSSHETPTTTTVSPNLVDKASKIVLSVLNRAREDTINRELGQSTDLASEICHLDDAQEQVEQGEFDQKPSTIVSRPLTLNAPKLNTAYVEEQQVDDLNQVASADDESVDLVVPNVRFEDQADLSNPPLSKKPLLLSKAELNEGKYYLKI